MDNKNEANIIELLDYLQETVELAPKVPITGKSMVDKNEFDEIIDQIKSYLPDEIKKAKWVMNEKERILEEAQKEYENVKKETMDIMRQNVENHDIVKEAKLRAQEIIALAQRDAKAIRIGSRQYSDEILSQLDKEIDNKKKVLIETLQKSFEQTASEVDGALGNACTVIKENISELRSM